MNYERVKADGRRLLLLRGTATGFKNWRKTGSQFKEKIAKLSAEPGVKWVSQPGVVRVP